MTIPSGYTALDFVGYTDKGTYSASATYVKNDLVHYDNSIWRCLLDDTTGQTPAEGTCWTIFINASTSASGISYSNSSSGLTSTDVQNGIDELAKKHATASITISHSGTWTSTTVNGSTMYAYSVGLSAVYADVPTVSLATSGSNALPTAAEQTAYALVNFATIDSSAKTLKLYATAQPASDFVINVEGVAV